MQTGGNQKNKLEFIHQEKPKQRFQNYQHVDGESQHPRKKEQVFLKLPDRDLFLYSAIVNEREKVEGNVNIIITAFDSRDVSK